MFANAGSQPDDESQQTKDVAVLKSHAAQLAEHFDTVQIIVTRHNPSRGDGTVSSSYGEGNWYARFGSVREWLVKEDATMRR